MTDGEERPRPPPRSAPLAREVPPSRRRDCTTIGEVPEPEIGPDDVRIAVGGVVRRVRHVRGGRSDERALGQVGAHRTSESTIRRVGLEGREPSDDPEEVAA